MLKGKKIGLVANNTSMVMGTHLVDTLVGLGIDLKTVFAPEHGFRGDADAGESVGSYRDAKTGVDVASIYGANKKPKAEQIKCLDIVIFDIQDVGLRFYTYLSSMHYIMEVCAENGVQMLLLDRPNPNGMYVDGPVLDLQYKSFVGMHPIPVVHGMTLGELARMINGEGWLAGGLKCELKIITCKNYKHSTRYMLNVKPSPNLPNMRSIYLYPSLCVFEATPISIGRGTEFPFQVYGNPKMSGCKFEFTPHSTIGAKNPPLKNVRCVGVDLRNWPNNDAVIDSGVDLRYLIDAYKRMNIGDKFFTSFFEKLIGVGYVRKMIVQGSDAAKIKERWGEDVEKFCKQRKPYLLYED